VPGPGTTLVDRLLGLAGGGVFPAGDVAAAAVRSYRTISPLPEPRGAIGCVFSVALSLGLPPVAVSHYRALGSPNAIICVWGPAVLLGLSSGCLRNRRPPEPPLEFAIYYLRLTICRELSAILPHSPSSCHRQSGFERHRQVLYLLYANRARIVCGGRARGPKVGRTAHSARPRCSRWHAERRTIRISA